MGSSNTYSMSSLARTGVRSTMLLVAVCLSLGACGSETSVSSEGETGVSEVDEVQVAPPDEPSDATFVIEPANPQSGENFEATFDAQHSRGGYFLLSLWNGEAWDEPAFLLESDAGRSEPIVIALGDGEWGVEDYGIDGPGPDGLVMPEELSEGTWRLCTANARDDACVQLVVGPE